jgi:hypothetical protein
LNVDVQEDVKEELQLNKFATDNVYLAGDDVLFNFQLENVGNQELQPKGEIRIYNRKGEEVASLEVNADGRAVSPSQSAQLASVWTAADGLGRFKAFLTVDYGKSQTASVQDTIYFWIVPWKQLLMLFSGSLILLVFFALYFHRWFEMRHHRRLVLAGHGVAQPVFESEPSTFTPSELVKTAVGLITPVQNGALYLFRKAAGAVRRGRSKRAAQEVEQVVAPEAPAPPLPTLAPLTKPKERSLQDVIGPVSEWRSVRPPAESSHGHTINLKNLRGEEHVAPSEGHVINLKKNK